MSRFFIELFNISITAGWLIAAVLLIRLLFKKIAPKWAVCLLWALVGIRLALPFSIESDLSLVPSKGLVNTDTVYSDIAQDSSLPNIDQSLNNEHNPIPDQQIPQQKPQTPPQYVDSGFGVIDDKINSALSSNTQAENPIKAVADKAWIIWALGCGGMLLYAVINYGLLRKRVGEFITNGDGIRRSDSVGSPFILGIIKPNIYLPLGLSAETEAQVIAHEKAHLKRRDHLIKPFGYLLLCIYWFNPLIWVAYVLLCRDIEMACDEKVVKNMNAEARRLYATALLECGVQHSRIAACPLAFGEIGVKQRVKNALNYKKPLFWIIIASVIVCIAVAVFFLTNPTNNDGSTDDEASQNSQDASDTSSESSVGGADDSDVSVDISVDVSEPETSEPEVSEPEVSEPEVSEPEVSEPEVSEPEVSEPEVSEPETSEPEVSEPEVSEPETSEPEPEEPLYSGKIYTYTVPGPNRRVQQFDSAAYVKEKILTVINRLDWQDKKVNYDYDFLIMVGDGTKAKLLYYNSAGFISDETDDRFATLTTAQAALMNAYLRYPTPEIPYKQPEVAKLTVAQQTLATPSVLDGYFYAVRQDGVMCKVYWPDCSMVKTGYEIQAELWAEADATYKDNAGYTPEKVLYAVGLKILSKPNEDSIPANRKVSFNQYNSFAPLTDTIKQQWQTDATQYGKSSKVFVIKSMNELNSFLSNLKLNQYGSNSAFEYYAESISEEYFKEKAILVTYAWSPRLLTSYTVTDISVANKALTVSITAQPHSNYSPEGIQRNLIVAEVDTAQLADCTSFKVNTTVTKTTEKQPVSVQDLEIVTGRLNMFSSRFTYNDDAVVITSKQQAELLTTFCDTINISNLEDIEFFNDESFFNDKGVVCFFLVSGSGGDKFEITDLGITEGNVISISLDKYDIGYTDDLYGYMHYVVIDKTIAENIKGCDFIINTIVPDYGEDWEWPA